MSTPWRVTQNTFESNTRKNYRKANTVGLFTDKVFAGVSGPDTSPLAVLRDYYRPRYAAYKAVYEAWIAMGAQGEGATLGLHEAEALIDHDVDDWEFTVQGTYRKGTPGYKTLFPDGITALKRGTREQRTATLNAFSANLALIPALASLKATVDVRIAQLKGAAEDQGTKKSTVKTDSASVEAARLALCTALYYVLGGLMQLYAETPASIDAYFDVETLRSLPQTVFKGAVHAGGQPVFIVERTLPADNEIAITNDGPTNITLYFAAGKTDGVPATGTVTVATGQSMIITAERLGASAMNRFLLVHDDDALTDGHYSVTLG